MGYQQVNTHLFRDCYDLVSNYWCSGVCILTLRGHADSVNSVQFLSYSNTLATCSADKTVSLWDVRAVCNYPSPSWNLCTNHFVLLQGLCVHTFYGHQHSCNSVHTTLNGYQMYSSDCFGHVLQWDVRSRQNTGHWDLGPFAVNSITTDPAGKVNVKPPSL